MPAKRRDDTFLGSMKTISPTDFGYEQARHLLNRAGFGGSPRQISTLAAMGPEAAVNTLVDFEHIAAEPVAADLFDKDIMRPANAEEQELMSRARRAGDETTLARIRAEVQSRERRDRAQIRSIQSWWLARMIESPRPLEEKMTLFWHGHFATSYRTIENSYHMFLQNQTYRTNALGNFGDLLFAIIRDPAMLAYLDNNDSRKGRPNENLAREIMELFSLGVGNYTENDIKEGARALTGYSFNDDEFVFNAQNHDTGPKTILGKKGALDGDDFVVAILQCRACADYITHKLYRYFVGDLPEDPKKGDPKTNSYLGRIASTLLSGKYEIKPVLRRIFMSEHFYSPSIISEQIKSPVQLIVGSVRSLDTPVRDLSILLDALDLMGQHIMHPPSVAGWDGGRSWINTSTMFVRQNILSFLLTGRTTRGYDPTARTDKYDPMPLLEELASAGGDRDISRVIEYLLRFTIGSAPAHAREALESLANENGRAVTPDLVTALLLLVSAMPEYQLC